jgi:hypothetical protein
VHSLQLFEGSASCTQDASSKLQQTDAASLVAALDAEWVEEDILIQMEFSNIATHSKPAWGSQANWMLHADLGKDGMSTRGEQLWAKQTGTGVFKICCIPFFTYGIALGDVVEADAKNIIVKVTEKSGHNNLRVAITGEASEIHGELHDWAEKSGLLYEWFEEKYLAVDLPPEKMDSADITRLKYWAGENKIAFEME